MADIEELAHKYTRSELERLKWDLRYYKYKSTQIADELEKSQEKVLDTLVKIREQEAIIQAGLQ